MNLRICIISHNRTNAVEKYQRWLGEDIYWYVGEGEAEAYRLAGAKNVIESGKLCPSRNAALRDAFAEGKVCLELSDDASNLVNMTPEEPGKFKYKRTMCEKLSLLQAIEKMYTWFMESPYKLAGVSPTNNPGFYDETFSVLKFIVGDMIMVKPCELRFDENLKLKEDYDYTIQHFKTYGGALRCNRLFVTFGHRKNPGGAVDFRNPERENEAIAYLKDKHPGFFRDNKQRYRNAAGELIGRPNEILMSREPTIKKLLTETSLQVSA